MVIITLLFRSTPIHRLRQHCWSSVSSSIDGAPTWIFLKYVQCGLSFLCAWPWLQWHHATKIHWFFSNPSDESWFVPSSLLSVSKSQMSLSFWYLYGLGWTWNIKVSIFPKSQITHRYYKEMAWTSPSQVQTSFSLSTNSQSSPHHDFLISINDTRNLFLNSYFSHWLLLLILQFICQVKIKISFEIFKGWWHRDGSVVKVLTPHTWGSSATLSTCVRWLTGTCNSSFRVSDASDLCRHIHSHARTPHLQTHRHTIILVLLKMLNQFCQKLGGILVTT